MKDGRPEELARIVERPNYFAGKVLTEDDLRQEQEYSRDRERAHNRLHGSGVVSGLEVEATKPSSGKVVVRPGSAIDAYGREIVLTEAVEVDVLGLVPSKRPNSVHVVIAYGERGMAPVPVMGGNGDDRVEPSRIREVPVFDVVECEDEDGQHLVIARIDFPRSAKTITARQVHSSVRRRLS